MQKFGLIKISIFVSFVFLLLASPVAAQNNASKASEVRTRQCEVKKKVIETRFNNLLDMSGNMVKVFTNIAERTKTFYTDKVLVKGLTVSNYDTLVAAIDTKKAAVDAAIDKAELDATSFNCESDNPKLAVQTFRTDMQDVKNKLKELRTAVRNLIQAVHKANKEVSITPVPTGV